MDALFDAYLSTDAAPLYRLRQEFGVTHLLVETRDFTDPSTPRNILRRGEHVSLRGSQKSRERNIY